MVIQLGTGVMSEAGGLTIRVNTAKLEPAALLAPIVT
jgi:hypothetical protein